jgi:nucleotide-binding universal stress UspA family protein
MNDVDAADPTYRSVLVPLDGSNHAAGALPTASALAARFDATIHAVTVALCDRQVERVRRAVALALGTDADDPRIHVEVADDVAAAVHRCASQLDPCLICLSTQGRGRVPGALLGSTAHDIIERSSSPVVVAGPFLVHPDAEDGCSAPPLGADHLVACVDGTPFAERGLPVAAAWARALGMKLTIVTVAEPCPPPARIGAPWRRHHGPDEDADEYMRRLHEQWAHAVAGLETAVVYNPITPGAGVRDYLASHPTGLISVTARLRDRPARAVFGSGTAEIVRNSTAPALVVPTKAEQPGRPLDGG